MASADITNQIGRIPYSTHKNSNRNKILPRSSHSVNRSRPSTREGSNSNRN